MAQTKRARIGADMQHECVDEQGLSYFPSSRTIIEPIRRVLERCRTSGMPVIFIHTVWRKDGSDVAPHTTSKDLRERGAREGSKGAEIIPELQPAAGEHLVVKKRYSAFYMTD